MDQPHSDEASESWVTVPFGAHYDLQVHTWLVVTGDGRNFLEMYDKEDIRA